MVPFVIHATFSQWHVLCYSLCLYFTLLGFADQRFHLLAGADCAGSLIIAKASMLLMHWLLIVFALHVCWKHSTIILFKHTIIMRFEQKKKATTVLSMLDLNEVLHH